MANQIFKWVPNKRSIDVLNRSPRRNFINLFGRSTSSVFTILSVRWLDNLKFPSAYTSTAGWVDPQTAISVHGGLDGRTRTVILAYNEKIELDFQNFFSIWIGVFKLVNFLAVIQAENSPFATWKIFWKISDISENRSVSFLNSLKILKCQKTSKISKNSK